MPLTKIVQSTRSCAKGPQKLCAGGLWNLDFSIFFLIERYNAGKYPCGSNCFSFISLILNIYYILIILYIHIRFVKV